MNPNLSVKQILTQLEAQIAQLEGQEALHAQQETYHREQRAACIAELARVKERYEAFRAAASGLEEIARRPAPLPIQDEDSTRKLTIRKMINRVVTALPGDEPFGPAAVAKAANAHYGKKLRRPLDGRAVSVVLRRLMAEGRIHLVREGKAHHEALYAKGRKPKEPSGS